MDTIKLTINGLDVTAKQDQTILDVVREHQLDTIPTLCHDPKLPPYGSCYLCVVEVEGVSKLIPSCASPVAAGMKIHTNNERIRDARKTALELLLSNHYADCLGPCKQTCPAGVDVQGYIALASMGKYDEAIRLIRETNPLPLVCGRVCVRECEIACRRTNVDEAVGVDYVKRFLTDVEIDDPWTPEIAPKHGKRVAIIGGGPSGLTCGYYLVREGYDIHLFEKMPHLGGMLRYGIPEYRLPKERLDREIKWITDLGIDVTLDAKLGVDFTIDSLLNEKYDAVYVAVGAHKAKSMDIPDETTTEGVLGGIDFLREVENGAFKEMKGNVIVVGGGNTAIDAARTALRLGASKVTLVYRRTRNEMPAHPAEIDAAIHEGTEMIYLSAPTRIVSQNGKLKALTCIRMELGEPDKSGRRKPVPVSGSEYDLECDYIISAIGQDTDLLGITDTGIVVSRWSTIEVNADTMQTSIPQVFAGGDVVSGPAVVIDAVAQGQRAADAIHEWLTTGKITPKKKEFLSRKDVWGEVPEAEFSDFEKIEREKMPELPADERIKTFEEVELGFSEEQMMHETLRCLECGCTEYFTCDLKRYADEYGATVNSFIGDVKKYKIDRRHPLITLDPNKCILCGRCIRVCSEVLQVSALGFVYRGFKGIVKPALEKALGETDCIACGNCIATCPTGAITEKLPFSKPGPWASTLTPSTCSLCSLGCQLDYKVFYDDIFSVSNRDEHSHNKGYLCVRGRFGYRSMLDPSRELKPMVKENGSFVAATRDVALSFAGDKIRNIIEKHGPQSVAVVGAPTLTNEELYLLGKLARVGLNTNRIGSFSRLINGVEQQALDEMIGLTTSSATLDDIAHADVVVVLNSHLADEHLIAELRIKEAMKSGAKLISFSSSETELTKQSDLWIDSRRGTNAAILNAVANELIKLDAHDRGFIESRTENFELFRASIAYWDIDLASEVSSADGSTVAALTELLRHREKNVVVVYNIDSLWEKSRNDLKAVGNLMLATGRIGKKDNGIVLLRDAANMQGMIDVGFDSNSLPGHVSSADKKAVTRLKKLWKSKTLDATLTQTDLMTALESDEIKAVLVFGEDPLLSPANVKLLSSVEFMLVADHFLTPTAREADVFLPLATPVETEGTYTACDRRVQRVTRVFEPKTGIENWQLIAMLGRQFAAEYQYESAEDIFEEMRKAIPAYASADIGAHWGGQLFADTFPTVDGKAHFACFDVDVTPYNRETVHYVSSRNYFTFHIDKHLKVKR